MNSMDTTAFDKLPEEVKEKVRQSRMAYEKAAQLAKELTHRFAICNLRVAAAADGTIALSGMVDNNTDEENIAAFLREAEKGEGLMNELTVVINAEPVSLTINGVTHSLTTLQELKQIVDRHEGKPDVQYILRRQDSSLLAILMNASHSLGIYMRYAGDSGYSTCNPKSNPDSRQDFLLSNGQLDEYGEDMLTDIDTGYDMMRYFVLTGRMHPAVAWREEG